MFVCVRLQEFDCTLYSSYFMVVYTVRVIQHEGVGSRSSMQLRDPNPSAILLLQYGNNHEIIVFFVGNGKRR